MSEALLKYQVKALSEQMDRIVAERDQLRADNARLRAELNAWNAIPAVELIAYWNAFGNDNDIIGDWINELRHGVNVGRYHAGLEPL